MYIFQCLSMCFSVLAVQVAAILVKNWVDNHYKQEKIMSANGITNLFETQHTFLDLEQ